MRPTRWATRRGCRWRCRGWGCSPWRRATPTERQELKDPLGVTWSLGILAAVAGAQGQHERAARLLGAAAAARERLGAGLSESGRPLHERARAAARAALGDKAWAAAWAAGRALPP